MTVKGFSKLGKSQLGKRWLNQEERKLVFDYNEKLGRIVVEKFGWENSSDSIVRLATLIGYPSNVDEHGMYLDTFNPKIREILDKLDGPYGGILLKMYELKNAK